MPSREWEAEQKVRAAARQIASASDDMAPSNTLASIMLINISTMLLNIASRINR